MRAALLLGTLLTAAGCNQRPSEDEPAGLRVLDSAGKEVAAPRQVSVHEGVAVIDQARVLSDAEKATLERRSAAVSREIGRRLTVVLVRPSAGDSLERVTWAIAQRPGTDGPLMLVVDVDAAAIRVDGAADSAKAAAIAGAIRDEVKAGRIAAGVSRGLDRVAQEERQG